MNEISRYQPKWRRALILLTALLAVFQVGAALRAVQIPGDIAAKISLPIPLEIAGGLLWAVVFALATVWLIQRKQSAAYRAFRLILGFIGYSFARLLIFARADYDRQRLPFLLIALFFVLIGSVAVVFLSRFLRSRAKSMETMEHGR